MRSDRRHKTEVYKARKLNNLKHRMISYDKSLRNINRSLKTPSHYIYKCDCERCDGGMYDKAKKLDNVKFHKESTAEDDRLYLRMMVED